MYSLAHLVYYLAVAGKRNYANFLEREQAKDTLVKSLENALCSKTVGSSQSKLLDRTESASKSGDETTSSIPAFLNEDGRKPETSAERLLGLRQAIRVSGEHDMFINAEMTELFLRPHMFCYDFDFACPHHMVVSFNLPKIKLSCTIYCRRLYCI